MIRIILFFLLPAAFAAIIANDKTFKEPNDILLNQQIGIPTSDILEAIEDQYEVQEGRKADYLFNLTAYLNTNRPPNVTALTFVPLITLLSAIFTG